MFSYQPQQGRGGGYIYQGLAAQGEADAIRNERNFNNMMAMVGAGVDVAKTVAGAVMGGPAGAAMASDGGGGLLDTFIGAYAKKEQDKSDSKIYGNLMKIVAPAFGKDGDSLLEQWNSLESDSDRASFGSSLLGSLGTISNMYMAKGRMGMQQQGQQIQQNAPIRRAQVNAAAQAAAGQQRMTTLPSGINPDAIP
jgi:hypothetical protein